MPKPKGMAMTKPKGMAMTKPMGMAKAKTMPKPKAKTMPKEMAMRLSGCGLAMPKPKGMAKAKAKAMPKPKGMAKAKTMSKPKGWMPRGTVKRQRWEETSKPLPRRIAHLELRLGRTRTEVMWWNASFGEFEGLSDIEKMIVTEFLK